ALSLPDVPEVAAGNADGSAVDTHPPQKRVGELVAETYFPKLPDVRVVEAGPGVVVEPADVVHGRQHIARVIQPGSLLGVGVAAMAAGGAGVAPPASILPLGECENLQ